MNIILSNAIISDFLSQYPQEKHTNCLIGIILVGIHNIKTFALDFNKILSQIESKQTQNTVQDSGKSLKNEIQELHRTRPPPPKPEDTPRFLGNENKPEKRSFSFQRITNKDRIQNKNYGLLGASMNSQSKSPQHVKTPSIVNVDIIPEVNTGENSEILKIADQFLNGRFVNEYCNSTISIKNKAQVPRLGINSKHLEDAEAAERKPKPIISGFNSSSHSGRYKSLSVLNGTRSVRGERNTSYSKFW